MALCKSLVDGCTLCKIAYNFKHTHNYINAQILACLLDVAKMHALFQNADSLDMFKRLSGKKDADALLDCLNFFLVISGIMNGVIYCCSAHFIVLNVLLYTSECLLSFVETLSHLNLN